MESGKKSSERVLFLGAVYVCYVVRQFFHKCSRLPV